MIRREGVDQGRKKNLDLERERGVYHIYIYRYDSDRKSLRFLLLCHIFQRTFSTV